MFKHKLGKEAKDKITGFRGILVARCEFLTGCNRYCIQPVKLKEDGQPVESKYFDEDQIEIVSKGIQPADVTSENRGACSPDPQRK